MNISTATKTLLLCTLLSSGCLHKLPLSNIPLHSREHLAIKWRPDYATALDEARFAGQPLLVVLTAGEKDGAMCLGGDYLRSSALADPRVIALIEKEMVPVWINIRTTPWPDFPFLDQVLVTAKVDGERRVTDEFSRSFFFRSLVVSPDGKRLLNPGAPTVAKQAAKLVFEGDWTYEANEPGEYLALLKHALERWMPERMGAL